MDKTQSGRGELIKIEEWSVDEAIEGKSQIGQVSISLSGIEQKMMDENSRNCGTDLTIVNSDKTSKGSKLNPVYNDLLDSHNKFRVEIQKEIEKQGKGILDL